MISSFLGLEPGADVLSKSDFFWFYDGTLQAHDDLRIPRQSKNVDVYIDKLEVLLQKPSTGRSVIIEFFKNGVSIGTVTVAAGSYGASTIIAKTLITAGDIMTVTINQVGSGYFGASASMYARVAA